MNEISNKALEAIKERHIHPKPKWQFLLRNYVVWIFFSVSIILGSLSFSVALFLLNGYDLPELASVSADIYAHLAKNLPYFWLIFIALFIGLAFYNFKHTKGSYRYRAGMIMAASVAASIALGTAFYYSGAGTKIDNALSARMPYYNRMVNHVSDFWMNPKEGFLAGTITSVASDTDFRLTDIVGKEWHVYGNNIFWHRGMTAQVGLAVRLVGTADRNGFIAQEIMPWPGMGMGGGMMGGGMMRGFNR